MQLAFQAAACTEETLSEETPVQTNIRGYCELEVKGVSLPLVTWPTLFSRCTWKLSG